MMWVLWILLANCGITWLEYLYRGGQYPHFTDALPYIILPVLFSQMALFYGFKGAPNLLLAGAVFSIINTLARVANSYYLGDEIGSFSWLGVLLLLGSIICLKIK